MAKRILGAIAKSIEIANQGQGLEGFENSSFVNNKNIKSTQKETEAVTLEPLVRVGYEVPKSIRKQINAEANEKDMEKKDIAHALFDYALKHKDKINFLKYKK